MSIVVLIIFALLVAMDVCSMKYSSGKLRKFVWGFNIFIACVIGIAIAVYAIGEIKINQDREKYDIESGTILSGYGYRGETVPGYYEVVRSGLFYVDSMLVKKENVEVSPLSSMFSDSFIYLPKGDGGIKLTEEQIFVNPWFYDEATNIVKIVPNYFWVTFELVIYALLAFIPVNIILFIVVMVRLKKAE